MDADSGRANMLARLDWRPDRVLLDDVVFRIEHARNDDWDLGDQAFGFYKTKALVDQYARFWATRASFRSDNIVELGMWDGGSIVFWYEYFLPKKIVGIDLQARGDSEYFRHYIATRGLQDVVATHWGVNQADVETLRGIVAREFDGPLDLVIDDASHLYGPTKTSLEVLLPLLRPGALYIIEDWAWEHWPEFQAPDHEWANETSPTTLVNQLTAIAGNWPELIASVTVFQGFVAVERGDISAASVDPLSVEKFVSYRSPPPAPASPEPEIQEPVVPPRSRALVGRQRLGTARRVGWTMARAGMRKCRAVVRRLQARYGRAA